MQKWTVQRSFSGGALWSGNCDRSLSLLLSHFFGGNIVLNVLQPCVKIAIWKIKCAFSWKPLYRGGGLKDAFSSRDGQLCVFKPLEKSLTAKPVSCWSFDRNQKVSAISFSLSPCQLPFSWSVGQVITALGKPQFEKGRVYLGIAQIAIGPPPPSLKRALWGTLFLDRLEQMPFELQFSLHKCPKPSWQGFRPPKPRKMPLWTWTILLKISAPNHLGNAQIDPTFF